MLIGEDIGILGAGVAGLAVARALALRGAKVTVYEQAPEIREVGAGLQISPNGVRVLAGLGLDPVSRAVRSKGVRLMDGYMGREVLYLDLAAYRPNDDFLLMHRADLIDLLHQGARDVDVDIRLHHKVEDIDGDEDGVTLNFEGGATARHGIVLGADGLHSKLRPMLNGPAKPFFTGQTAWRATVPALGGEPEVAMVHMAAGRHVVSYPLRGGEIINIVAVEERSDWIEEGWFHEGDPEELRRNFSNFCPGITALLGRVEQVSRWGLFRHPVAVRWHSDRTALLGDAAHPTLPFLAQGAVMALEDAWVLADCLGKLPLDQALPAYQMCRRPRVTRVIEAANANARNYHLSGPKRFLGHTALRLAGQLAPKQAVEKFAWLYDYDVTAE
ncbi:FAD-dependent monooxygenase [Celeribacter litoreus]|uniref:FAD-dependent monooxygenase n=1 Tax=Celeribacter litoreus TaxID=2876714 RepID=UPI001CCE6230|nr:FAD-dependent monooxygenase [Celeribacter litoreus]MCA0043612.1 FAD-dependent monooxygenase [Celeribacter litoreus]